MEEVTNISYEAIRRYFTTLSSFGYKSYKEVDKLLVLLFIDDLLKGSLSQYVTEEDYRVLIRLLNNLGGTTCLVPYIQLEETLHVQNKKIGSFVSTDYQSASYQLLDNTSFTII